MVSTPLKRCRGAMRESDDKALQDPVRRTEGRRLQEEARAEAERRRAHKAEGSRAHKAEESRAHKAEEKGPCRRA